ncbi:APN1 lyase, partial [Amia calva]|nr:APN1 lyase [Amia calva]
MAPRKRAKRKAAGEAEEESEGATAVVGSPKERKDEKRGKGGRERKFVGAHMSIAGGLWRAVSDSVSVGGRSFALFLGSQRSWRRPPLQEEVVCRFREACAEHGFEPHHILPHGSYLMNCGSPKQEVFEKSQLLLVEDLSRCSRLGLSHYNLHPGASLNEITTELCLQHIAEAINHAHQQTPGVVTVLENMSGQGSVVGGQFSDLRGVIDRVRDQSRVAVCLDTCHAFAAGYDLSAVGGVGTVLGEFDRVVGLRYLAALHLNDSKGKLGCHLDRHEDIGRGQIGIAAFQDIMNDPRLDGIPMILETPGRPGFEYAEQIELLYSLCKD